MWEIDWIVFAEIKIILKDLSRCKKGKIGSTSIHEDAQQSGGSRFSCIIYRINWNILHVWTLVRQHMKSTQVQVEENESTKDSSTIPLVCNESKSIWIFFHSFSSLECYFGFVIIFFQNTPLFSKIFNRFHWLTLVAIPGFLGALSIFAVPNQIAIMFCHSALVMVRLSDWNDKTVNVPQKTNHLISWLYRLFKC